MSISSPKITLITGATSGIGLAAATGLAGEGHFVIGVGRSQRKINAARQSILEKHPDAEVLYLLADLSSQGQVRRLAQEVKQLLADRHLDHLDVLVNNAGAVSSWFTLTEDEIELQFAVNHLAGFLLTHELMPLLQKAEQARILTTSSASHRNTRMHWKDVMLRKNYGTLRAYKQSKLANVLFTLELNRRLGPDSTVTAFAVDPGLVNTNIGEKGTNGFVNWFWKKRSSKGTPPEIAAETIIYLACQCEIPYRDAFYWKDCHPISPSRYAQKEEPAARLWVLSITLCGID